MLFSVLLVFKEIEELPSLVETIAYNSFVGLISEGGAGFYQNDLAVLDVSTGIFYAFWLIVP
jgi:hypothetical protein